MTDAKERAALAWWKRLCETNNECMMALFFCKSRFLVLKGGGGSGKSIFAGRKILERCATEPGHRMLVVRKVYRTIEGSCFHQLCSQAKEFYPGVRVQKSPMRILFRNGSEIVFAGLDDVEKLKSIHGITGIWIEEASEISEADFNQLDIRLRDKTVYYKQMILSFNPVSVTHWLKKRFFDKSDERATVSETTFRDNRFLSEEAVQTLEGFRETDEYYYMVYALGQWGVTGKTVFPARLVAERMDALTEPLRQGYFVYDDTGVSLMNIRWVDDDASALIRIYREPERGIPYVLGGDTAGDGSDRFTGILLDNVTGTQAAMLLMTTGEDEYVRQMYCLGRYFNQALIAIEDNFSTFPNKELARLSYPKIYVREAVDSFTGRPQERFGWMTTKLSRNTAIAELIKYVKDGVDRICDRDVLAEMLTFVRNEDFRAEAEAGAHDDCVMGYAIAIQARGQQSRVKEGEKPAVVWTNRQWQAYRDADDATKARLISDWGNPYDV